jgi:hypothetical protein
MKMRSFVLRGGVVLAIVAAVLLAALGWRFGSMPVAMAWMRGERFVLSPVDVDLGECESRTEHVVKFKLTNLADRSIRVVGSEQTCSCVTLGDLPIDIEPNATAEVAVRFFVAARETYSQQLILYIDDGGELRSVAASVKARIKPKEPEAGKDGPSN